MILLIIYKKGVGLKEKSILMNIYPFHVQIITLAALFLSKCLKRKGKNEQAFRYGFTVRPNSLRKCTVVRRR